MIDRLCLLAAACGIAAATAGAAPPVARNGLIAFTSDRSDNWAKAEVYVVRADGKDRTNVSRGTTTPDDEDPHQTWSPDGTRIAFSGENALVVAAPDGSSRELWNEGDLQEANVAPSWSPDGRDIAVAGVWLVSTATRQARRITDGSFDGEPGWSHDGTLLAFTRDVEGEFPDLYVVRRDGTGLRRLGRRIACCVSWSPRGHFLLYGGQTGALFIVDAATGKRRSLNLGHLQVASDSNAVWAPRGKWIAVPTESGLYVIDSTGRKRRRLPGPSFGTPAWSPTGKSLAIAGAGDIYTVSVDTRRLRRIVRGRCREDVTRVSWAPDGKHIAFASSKEGENDTEIYTMRDDGSSLRRLTSNCSRYERDPAWSPDGKRLAYSTGHIFVMNRDGSRKAPLTRAKASDGAPSWSPDGRRIVFARSFFRQGNGTGLFTIRADRSGSARRLTRRSPWSDADPAWAPRGRRIAFVSTRFGRIPQIYVMGSDGSRVTALTQGPLSSVNPAWSPDGARLAFVRDSDIWTMNADGTNPARLTAFFDLTEAEQPAWSPDGTQIVFSRDIDYGRGSQNALFVIPSVGGEPRIVASANGNYTDPSWQAIR